MRGDDEGGLFFGSQRLEQLHDFAAGAGIEITGRLVGQQQHRFVDERAGDGDALLFPAGKFGGFMVEPVFEANARE